MGCVSSVAAAPAIEKRYSIEGEIGRGTYGKILACTHVPSGKTCAVKIIASDDPCRDASRRTFSKGGKAGDSGKELRSLDHESMQREHEIWKKISGHPHIVELIEAQRSSLRATFIMEKCSHSLADRLKMDQPFDEPDMRSTFRQLLLGVQHMHSFNIAHRDIKPGNYLYCFDDTIKLCDFGCADFEPAGGFERGAVGTARYMSPEMVQGRRYTRKTDIWSLGGVMFGIAYLRDPYDAQYGEVRGLIAANVPKLRFTPAQGKKAPSANVEYFIKKLLDRSDARRKSADECLRYEFVNPEADTAKKQGGLPMQETPSRRKASDPSSEGMDKAMSHKFSGDLPTESGDRMIAKKSGDMTSEGIDKVPSRKKSIDPVKEILDKATGGKDADAATAATVSGCSSDLVSITSVHS